MDPLTQGLLGACVGQAVYGRALGRRALGWGALLGMVPDLDVVMNATSPFGEWLWHRGPTHALWFGPVVGTAAGWLLWKRQGGRRRDWIGLAVLALFTHPLLDVFTTYGTQLLAPFSSQRFAWDGIAIVDPLYSLALAVALVVALRCGDTGRAARASACWALALSCAYLGLGVVVNERVESLARAQLAAEGVGDARVAAYPTMLQLPLRRVVARHGDEVRVGWLSVLVPGPIAWQRFTAAGGPLVEAARATEEARLLEWFAMGETAARVERTGDGGTRIEIDDLRYGVPGDARDGLWGVRVRLDAAGRPIGRPERIDRPLPASTSELLGLIVRRTFGSS